MPKIGKVVLGLVWLLLGQLGCTQDGDVLVIGKILGPSYFNSYAVCILLPLWGNCPVHHPCTWHR